MQKSRLLYVCGKGAKRLLKPAFRSASFAARSAGVTQTVSGGSTPASSNSSIFTTFELTVGLIASPGRDRFSR